MILMNCSHVNQLFFFAVIFRMDTPIATTVVRLQRSRSLSPLARTALVARPNGRGQSQGIATRRSGL